MLKLGHRKRREFKLIGMGIYSFLLETKYVNLVDDIKQLEQYQISDL